MANNCAACDELKNIDANFIVNGLGDTECTSLANNTGLSPSSGNDDCTDLELMNDCLVKNMGSEIDSYTVCNWKDYMKLLVKNVWTMFKGIICSICGLWEAVDNVEVDTTKIDCIVKMLQEGHELLIDETATSSSYIVAGQGVSFLKASESEEFSHEVNLEYIAGGLMRVYGSCRFYTSSFTDAGSCWHLDNANANAVYSSSRAGNSRWGSSGKPAVAGDLVYEVRVKLSQYPWIKEFVDGFGMGHAGGSFNAHVRVFNAGQYAYGTHGYCHTDDGSPGDSGYSNGHLVPEGWVYVQVRIDYLDQAMNSGSRYSPYTFFGIRLNADEITC